MTVPNVLSVLCSNDMTPRQHLESQQALFRQFAKIIDFTLKFDDLKVLFVTKWNCSLISVNADENYTVSLFPEDIAYRKS